MKRQKPSLRFRASRALRAAVRKAAAPVAPSRPARTGASGFGRRAARGGGRIGPDRLNRPPPARGEARRETAVADGMQRTHRRADPASEVGANGAAERLPDARAAGPRAARVRRRDAARAPEQTARRRSEALPTVSVREVRRELALGATPRGATAKPRGRTGFAAPAAARRPRRLRSACVTLCASPNPPRSRPQSPVRLTRRS